jgi:hypothetical protein
MGLIRETLDGTRHPAQEETFGSIRPAVSGWRSHEFFGFWNRKRCEDIWKYLLYAPPKPNIEKVREVCVANVVVVRRVR